MSGSTSRDRRAHIFGALTIAIATLSLRGIPAWREWVRESRAEAGALATELQLARTQAQARTMLVDTLNARNARFLQLAPRLLSGSTSASATSSLAGLVSGAAAIANVRLGAVQLSADSNATRVFARISARAQATGDVEGLTTMLAELEGGEALLRITELSVSQGDPAAAPDRAESLQVSFTVQGLALLRPSKTK